MAFWKSISVTRNKLYEKCFLKCSFIAIPDIFEAAIFMLTYFMCMPTCYVTTVVQQIDKYTFSRY